MGFLDEAAAELKGGTPRPATPPPPAHAVRSVEQATADDDQPTFPPEPPAPPPGFGDTPKRQPQFDDAEPELAEEDDVDVDDPFGNDVDDDEDTAASSVDEPTMEHGPERVEAAWNRPVVRDGDDNASGAEALHGNTPGFDDDDDDGGGIRTRSGKSGVLTSLLEKPKQIFEQHPDWKRPALFGAGALAVALVIVFAFGGSPASDTPSAPTPPAAQEEAEKAPDAGVVQIMPKTVSGSCPAGSTRTALAFSSRKEDAWRCLRAHNMNGQIINLTFADSVCVKSVTLMPGWNWVEPNGTDHWNESRLVSRILWRAGGKQFVQNLNPTRAGATFTFPGKCVVTKEMSLTIQATVLPSAVVQGESPNGGDGVLPPPLTGSEAAAGPDESEVDKWVALQGIVVMGTELS